MEFKMYNHTIAENPGRLKLKCGKRVEMTAHAYHGCVACGTVCTGTWEYPSYCIPEYFIDSLTGREHGGNKISDTDNNLWHLYFEYGQEWWKDKNKLREWATATNRQEGQYRREIFHPEVYDDLIKTANIPEFLKQYRKEFLEFVDMRKCPICGSDYVMGGETNKPTFYNSRDKGWPKYSWARYRLFDDDPIYKDGYWNNYNRDLRGFHEEIDATARAKAKQSIQKLENAACENRATLSISDINQLKEFLKSIVYAEQNIQQFSQRLEELYVLRTLKGGESAVVKIRLLEKTNAEVQKLKDAYDAVKKQRPEARISIQQFQSKKPPMPQKPSKPHEPILKKPGLFNKKKVLEENAKLTAQYEAQLLQYQADCEKYEQKMDAYRSKVREQEEQASQKYAEAVEKAKIEHAIECDNAKKKYDDAAKLLKTQKENLRTPESIIVDSIDNEVTEVEKLLNKLFASRHQLYSCGVIFEKYHYFVAVSMFYEYLSSGRCAALEGPNGAYNIYESEIRANMIIAQLTQIIDSLEQIKENQYVIYKAIKDVKNELACLNEKTQTMIQSLKETNATLENIAYNTEVTAYYSKKNAELTNALGYLVALS